MLLCHAGTDAWAAAAAALAGGARVFASSDPTFSGRLLTSAAQLYHHAATASPKRNFIVVLPSGEQVRDSVIIIIARAAKAVTGYAVSKDSTQRNTAMFHQCSIANDMFCMSDGGSLHLADSMSDAMLLPRTSAAALLLVILACRAWALPCV